MCMLEGFRSEIVLFIALGHVSVVLKSCIIVRAMLVSVILILLCRRTEILELVDQQQNISNPPEPTMTGLYIHLYERTQ